MFLVCEPSLRGWRGNSVSDARLVIQYIEFVWRCLLFKYCRALAWGLLFVIKLFVGLIYSGVRFVVHRWVARKIGFSHLQVTFVAWLGDCYRLLLDKEVHRERSDQTVFIIIVWWLNYTMIFGKLHITPIKLIKVAHYTTFCNNIKFALG